jgi:hypothetical protein
MTFITLFGIAVTTGAYALSLFARRRWPSPLTTPVLFSTAIAIAVLATTTNTRNSPRLNFALRYAEQRKRSPTTCWRPRAFRLRNMDRRRTS